VVDDGPAYHPDEPRERRGERRSKKMPIHCGIYFFRKIVERGSQSSRWSRLKVYGLPNVSQTPTQPLIGSPAITHYWLSRNSRYKHTVFFHACSWKTTCCLKAFHYFYTSSISFYLSHVIGLSDNFIFELAGEVKIKKEGMTDC
jgi:hypothetical protein